jgi:hypothetical protein
METALDRASKSMDLATSSLLTERLAAKALLDLDRKIN